MTPEQIEDIGRRKVLDYMEDLIIQLSVAASSNPEGTLKEIETEAFQKCNYDDPTIDRELYQKLQEAIKRHLTAVFKSISKKAERKFDYF